MGSSIFLTSGSRPLFDCVVGHSLDVAAGQTQSGGWDINNGAVNLIKTVKI